MRESLLIDDKGYIFIEGWMRTKLNLKNNELLIYSIIHGFTNKADKHEFNGSLQYLADWCGCTKQGAWICLKSLVNKNYINKTEVYKNNVKYCSYSINQATKENSMPDYYMVF